MVKQARVGLSLLLVPVLVLAGCGDDGNNGGVKGKRIRAERLVVAAAFAPTVYDPLTTESQDGLEVARQIYEPLTERVHRPRSNRWIPGLVRSWRQRGGGKLWLASLRRSVRFQDGTAFNASAVARNGRRWLGSSVGRTLTGNLDRVAARGRYTVAFTLATADRLFPAKMANPRLGVVSAAALKRVAGGSRTLATASAGTGPFKLALVQKGKRTLLSVNTEWWAHNEGIRVALNSIAFRWVGDEAQRIDNFSDGTASMASSLTQDGIDHLSGSPNSQIFGAPPGRVVAVDRWLQGYRFSGLGAESLAGTWISSVEPES